MPALDSLPERNDGRAQTSIKRQPAGRGRNPGNQPLTSSGADLDRARFKGLGAQILNGLSLAARQKVVQSVKKLGSDAEEFVGESLERKANLQQRADESLLALPLNSGDQLVLLHGVPSLSHQEDVISMLVRAAPSLRREELEESIKLQPAPLNAAGAPSPTTIAVIERFPYTNMELRRFMADGSGHPEDLYIEHKLETYNILVIKPDEHLKQFLDILETLGWKPWQVESFVLGEINQSLHDADIMRSANSVRLKITRQVGNSHVKARVRYADGNIAFIVSDTSAFTEIIQRRPRFTLRRFGALPPIYLSYERGGSYANEAADVARRARSKEASALAMATARSTPMLVTRVQGRLVTEIKPGSPSVGNSLLGAERNLHEAMGGKSCGILELQLRATATGQPLFNGHCTFWIGDPSGEPRICTSMLERLSRGGPPLKGTHFANIKLSKVFAKETVTAAEVGEVTVDEVASALAMGISEGKQYIMPARLANGDPLPWRRQEAAGNAVTTPLTSLGPPIPENGPFRDIRTLFDGMAGAPSVRTLCAAIHQTRSDGLVNAYEQKIGATEVLVLMSAIADVGPAGSA